MILFSMSKEHRINTDFYEKGHEPLAGNPVMFCLWFRLLAKGGKNSQFCWSNKWIISPLQNTKMSGELDI